MLRSALPWIIFVVVAGTAACGYVLFAANGARDVAEQSVLGTAFIGYALVGTLVAWRRPENPIGWILLGVPACTGLGFTAEQLAVYATARPDALPGAAVASWFASWLWFPGLGLLGFGLLLYPNGQLASGRWRLVMWLLVAAILAMSVLFAFAPTPVGDAPFENPLAVLPPGLVAALEGIVGLLFVIAIVTSATAPIARFRNAGRVERAQLKWFLFAAGLLIVTVPVSLLLEGTSLAGLAALLFPVAIGALPVAIAIAILRHRLFDIDRIINRTLVYGGLTAVLGAVYGAAVLLLQGILSPITGGGTLAVAGSTLAVAAVFQPARRRIQRFVDRRFYRSRYDLSRTVDDFSQRLRSQLDLSSLTDELASAADETMRPASVSVWVRQPAEPSGRDLRTA